MYTEKGGLNSPPKCRKKGASSPLWDGNVFKQKLPLIVISYEKIYSNLFVFFLDANNKQ